MSVKQIEKKISGINDTIEELDNLFKENIKFKTYSRPRTSVKLGTLRRETVQIIGMEGKETQAKGTGSVLNEILEGKCPKNIP